GVPPMNFLKFRITREKKLFLKLDDGTADKENIEFIINNPDVLCSNIANLGEEKIILGIRPKDMIFLETDEKFEGLRLKGEITYVESLGDESIAELRIGQSSLKVSNILSRMDNLIVGKEATFGIKYDKINLFSSSGERIQM
ncbi:MAG: hypothetical protein QN424_06440, partial [Nitrososphaeraceae archaeon]|nr:hypothetical protein [Nitrososphaeraceae archaeon]